MQKFTILLTVLTFVFLTSCSKKNIPSKPKRASIDYSYDSTSVKKTPEKEAIIEVEKKEAEKKAAPTYPKIITVNDVAAKKSVDGRMYYDIQGRRYWKNFKDGKYYLFNKSMYNDPDFKPRNDN
jgi:hypothetical protein